MTHELTIGQKLWFVPSDERDISRSHEVDVVRIGRKWIELSNGHRIHIETLRADGRQYASPGRCWLCRADWEQDWQAGKAYRSLERQMKYSPRDGVTLEDIQQAASLLRITLD